MRAASLSFLVVIATACGQALVSSGFNAPSPESLDQRSGFRWVRDSTPHFHLRVEEGSRAAGKIDSLSTALERAIETVRQKLSLTGNPQKIHGFAVDSAKRVGLLLGRTVDGRAFYETRVFAFSIVSNWESTARHEITHVLLRNEWQGVP